MAADATDVAGADGQRVQPGGAVAVDDALGVPGRAARVAHRRGVALVHLGPLELLGLPGQQVLVEQDLLAGGAQRVEVGRGGVRPGDQHVGHGGEVRQLCGQQRHQRVVDDDHPVLGVVGDVDQLLREEPDVEGVEHRTHRRHREVGLEVLDVVPLEGRDPLVAGDAEAAQSVGQLGGTATQLGVRPGADAVGGRGHDLGVGVDRRAVLHQRADGELGVLHGALHGGSWCSEGRRRGHLAPRQVTAHLSVRCTLPMLGRVTILLRLLDEVSYAGSPVAGCPSGRPPGRPRAAPVRHRRPAARRRDLGRRPAGGPGQGAAGAGVAAAHPARRRDAGPRGRRLPARARARRGRRLGPRAAGDGRGTGAGRRPRAAGPRPGRGGGRPADRRGRRGGGGRAGPAAPCRAGPGAARSAACAGWP